VDNIDDDNINDDDTDGNDIDNDPADSSPATAKTFATNVSGSLIPHFLASIPAKLMPHAS